MADETNSEKIEFNYTLLEDRREKLPIIQLKIVTGNIIYPDTWLKALLDTGYDGGLLIPLDQYRNAELQMTELPVEQWDIAESITGEITLLQASVAQVKIKDLDNLIELRIETFQGNNAILLGLNGIKNLMICLDGLNQILRILK